MQKLLRPTCSVPIRSLSVGGTAIPPGTLTLTSSFTPITTLPFSFSISLSLSSSPRKYIAMAVAAPSISSSPLGLAPTASASRSASKSLPLSTLPAFSSSSAMSRCLSLTHKHTATRAPIQRLPWLLPRRASFNSTSEGEGEDTKEHKPFSTRLHRRQRASSSSSSPITPNPDLLAIPGVGPRNLRKLVRKGIAGVAQLKQLYKDKVFVRAVHEANWMNEMEISIYDSWFDPVVSSLPGLIPDGFIYLRASPDTCHKRMKLRKRAEEGGVSLDYLRDLHEKHESWLFPFQSGNRGILSVNKLPQHVDNTLHPEIRDRVFYLEGDHMHSSIQKVPALVLDCEPNIDFSKDIEAKRQYARQVAEFFEFVKKKKEVSPKEGAEGEQNGEAQGEVLMPHEGGLWLPDGKPFPQGTLKPLDFRRAMSFMSG
ncbi:hypothetical protein PIB30_021558 [Stylosanthes scabra]|uniref:Deoxynucleoside kinase domain-containing protein n=1 Tax=Stylosanthes scabra TaxID=79078 RepID=A0ABU6S981_9FABA|nr:hypothetical protein [Stylosanthes scabra]